MRFSNLHTHTVFSDGKHTLRENIEAAIASNMLSLGFSDHSDTFCDSSYCMKQSAYGDYIKTINSLKQEYNGVIPVFCGIEKDYYSNINSGDFDFVIASVHYINKNGICHPVDHSGKQQLDCIADAFGGSVLDFAKQYFDLVVENVIKSKPTLVGHFDVITKFSLMPENDEKYRNISIDALKAVLNECNYIEVNTGAISRGWRNVEYPVPYLLDIILKNGGEVVLSSDSHNKNNLTYHFCESVQNLKKIGFDHISYLDVDGYKKNQHITI